MPRHSAYFELPEVRLGVIAGSGGTGRLTRLMGPHWGKWMAMAGQRVDAEQAKAIGFVHAVLPEDSFQEPVASLARSLVAIPIEAMGSANLVADIARDTDRTTQRHINRIANGRRAACPGSSPLPSRSHSLDELRLRHDPLTLGTRLEFLAVDALARLEEGDAKMFRDVE